MHPEIKDAWVKALESGEYKQGYCSLRTADDKYCCLGVLCQLAVEAGVISEPKQYTRYGDWHYGGDTAFLPTEVKNWAGVQSGLIKLIDMNDGAHNRFKTIARYIRENL